MTRAVGTGELARVEATAREAQAIASFTEPDQRRLRLGFDAERRRVLDGALSGYRVVYFATHGLVLGRLSGLVLSKVDRRGRPVDGFLRSWEVDDLGLRAHLVVLSACRTGPGAPPSGGGGHGVVARVPRVRRLPGARQPVGRGRLVDRRAHGAVRRGYLAQGPPRRPRSAKSAMVRGQPEWSVPTIGPASCSRACRAETLRAARPSAGAADHGTGRVELLRVTHPRPSGGNESFRLRPPDARRTRCTNRPIETPRATAVRPRPDAEPEITDLDYDGEDLPASAGPAAGRSGLPAAGDQGH